MIQTQHNDMKPSTTREQSVLYIASSIPRHGVCLGDSKIPRIQDRTSSLLTPLSGERRRAESERAEWGMLSRWVTLSTARGGYRAAQRLFFSIGSGENGNTSGFTVFGLTLPFSILRKPPALLLSGGNDSEQSYRIFNRRR